MKPNGAGTRNGQGRYAKGEQDGRGGSPPAGGVSRRQSAYTLAELLVAVLILAIMVISLYAGFSASFAVVRSNREELRASQILMRQVEALRLCAWSQLSNRSLQESFDPLRAADNAGGTVYSVTVGTNAPDSIQDGGPYTNDMRLVTITVCWTNFNGDTPIVQSRQVQTHVARYGLQNYFWGAAP
jgi:prepilin-type N-terminal cleavage/methylation domain-containing protein